MKNKIVKKQARRFLRGKLACRQVQYFWRTSFDGTGVWVVEYVLHPKVREYLADLWRGTCWMAHPFIAAIQRGEFDHPPFALPEVPAPNWV